MKIVRWVTSILTAAFVILSFAMPVFTMQVTQNPQSGRTDNTNTVYKSSTVESNIGSGNIETSNTDSRNMDAENTNSASSVDTSGEDNSQPNASIYEDMGITLPPVSVGSEAAGIIANGTDVTPPNTMQMLLGIVFWVCIVIGILVVVVVIVAGARKSPKGGLGKKRYERKPMTPKGKRILNERYYRNIKK